MRRKIGIILFIVFSLLLLTFPSWSRDFKFQLRNNFNSRLAEFLRVIAYGDYPPNSVVTQHIQCF